MYSFDPKDYRILPPAVQLPVLKQQVYKTQSEKWRQTQADLFQHIHTSDARLPMTKQIIELRKDWLNTFYTRAVEEKGLSENDLLFVLLCYAHCCDQPSIRTRTVVCAEVATRMRIMISQHTEDPWPSDRDIRDLFEDVACYITSGVEDILEPLEDNELKKIDEITQERYMSLHLLPINDEQREEALKARARKEKTNMGSLYNRDYTSLDKVFVPLANRLFGKIYSDAEMVYKYPMRSGLPIQVEWRKRVEEWLNKKSLVHYEDVFTIRWNSIALNMFLPIGAHCQVLRKAATESMTLIPMNLLGQEIGIDTTTAITEKLDRKKVIIAADPTGLFYDALLMGTIAHIIDSQYRPGEVEIETLKRDKKGWLKCFYIDSSLLHKEIHRLEDVKRNFMKPRRPLIVRIQKRYLIHNKKQWIEATDFTDAWLIWCWLVKYEYEGELDDGVNIKAILDQFLVEED